jgi:hypothetical protein
MKKRKPRTATIRRDSFSALAAVPCLLLLITSFSFAHGPQRSKPFETAAIFGTVWGPNDQPLPGVKVKMRRFEDKKANAEKYSNRLGEFEFQVPAGKQDYIIWADTKGYKLPNGQRLQPGTEVTVHIESNERADTGLHLK